VPVPDPAPDVALTAAAPPAGPPDRDRVVDLVRCAAIAVVVVWHTTLSPLYLRDGRLVMGNLIDVVPGVWALTWVGQVMPVFFAVGGYVHLAGWRSDPSPGSFLRRRARRLGRPLVPVVVVWALVEAGLLLAGHPSIVVLAPSLLTPLWFLVVYAAAAALVPLTARLHERWGARVVVIGGVIVLGLDALRLAGAVPLAVPATALVWLLCHQLGYLWRDGIVRGPRHGLLLVAAAVAGLALLTGPGPYAPSMVASVANRSNMLPTTPPILLVGILQLGLVLVAYGPLTRLLDRPRWWRPVAAVNAVAMPVYLAHMVAALVLVVAVDRLAGPLPSEPDAAWWWLRPVWLAGVLLVLAAGLVAVRAVKSGTRRTTAAYGRARGS
jgi:hypothetical protein